MKNSEDKVTIHYEDLMDYYDLYVNGLNCVASGTLYLTGDAGLLTSLDPILVNGIDSGEVGMQYDFDVISDYCIRVNDFQPLGQGELDFIYVDNGYLYKLSGMYNYGYHKINITVSDGFGVIPIADIENIEATDIYIADGEQYTDPWVAYDGDESTNVRYGYNANNAYLTFTFTEARPVSAVRFLGYPPSETFKFWVEYSSDKNIWTKVANGDKAYSRRNWGNEWFPYNFGEEVTAKYFRIAMNTFVVPVYGYEVELYGSSLSIEEEPVEVFETNYVLPTSPGVGYTGSNAYVQDWNAKLTQMALSTPYDLSTATVEYSSTIDPLGDGATWLSMGGCFDFSLDGTRMFMMQSNAGAYIVEIELGTPWDLSGTKTRVGTHGTQFSWGTNGSLVVSEAAQAVFIFNSNEVVYKYT